MEGKPIIFWKSQVLTFEKEKLKRGIQIKSITTWKNVKSYSGDFGVFIFYKSSLNFNKLGTDKVIIVYTCRRENVWKLDMSFHSPTPGNRCRLVPVHMTRYRGLLLASLLPLQHVRWL